MKIIENFSFKKVISKIISYIILKIHDLKTCIFCRTFKLNKTNLLKRFQSSPLHYQLKMFCTQVICLCFVIGLVILPSDLAPPIDLETPKSKDYWSQTGLKLSTLHSVINKKICYATFHDFLGCMQSISVLVNSVLGRDTNLIFSDAKIKKGISSISDIGITSSKKKAFKDASQVLEDFKTSMTEKIKAWKILYHRTLKPQKHQIHFYQILADIITHHQFPSRSIIDRILLRKKTVSESYRKKLIGKAINAYLSITQSPHDHLIPLKLIQDQSQVSQEEYSGIGLILFHIHQHLIVKRVLDNSPAFQAGLKPGDIVSKVQGRNVSKMKSSESSQVISKVAGKTVYLEILRQGTHKTFKIDKKNIKISNVKTEYIQDHNKKWGLIRISSFYKTDTCTQVEKAIYKFQEHPQVSGLVIDLRNNPGGLVDEALCTADLFLPKDYFMLEIRPFDQSKSSQLYSSLLPQVTDLPLVILINAGSASSAEIVAGILRDHNRGVLIGERTFGKGTILHGTAFQYPKYPNLIHYQTSAKFYFPSRRTNHILGIIPDHIVKFQNSSLVPFREEDLFVYQLPSFQVSLKKEKPLYPLYPHQSAFQNYQNCLADLKTSQNQQAKTLAKTMLRCVTAQKNFFVTSS